MKKKVLQIVTSALMNSEDNLYRANLEFGRMAKEQLGKEHGRSGKTRDEIMQGYRDHHEELKQCLEWVNEKD